MFYRFNRGVKKPADKALVFFSEWVDQRARIILLPVYPPTQEYFIAIYYFNRPFDDWNFNGTRNYFSQQIAVFKGYLFSTIFSFFLIDYFGRFHFSPFFSKLFSSASDLSNVSTSLLFCSSVWDSIDHRFDSFSAICLFSGTFHFLFSFQILRTSKTSPLPLLHMTASVR
jgi:hypothetical protein